MKSCLVRYFDYPLDEVDLKVRQVHELLTLIESKNDKFNPLMKYHADPFDVAARVAGTAPGEKQYELNLPRYLVKVGSSSSTRLLARARLRASARRSAAIFKSAIANGIQRDRTDRLEAASGADPRSNRGTNHKYLL